MKIATILPTPFLGYGLSGYHLALAQIAEKDDDYRDWYRRARAHADFVMLDNGAAELGEGIAFETLIELAHEIDANEVVLPDVVGDAEATLKLGRGALDQAPRSVNLVAVPQGRTLEEYGECLREMLTWPISTIGISRFVINNGLVQSRAGILAAFPTLRFSDKAIHLLGCAADPLEIWDINERFPGAVRGVDSGVAAIYAQAGLYIGDDLPKPQAQVDFQSSDFGTGGIPLLVRNINAWRNRVLCGRWER